MKNVPKLRFSGFSDEWEEKILKDISDVRDGTHDSPKYLQEGYPLVTSKNLGEHGKLNLDNINLISEEDYININKRSKVDIGDILFGMIGTIGNPVMVEREGFAIKNVALIKELDVLKNSFLIQLLNSSVISRQFYRENTGGTQKFIALGNIRNLNIQLPSKDEQEKIANFLTKVDKLIEKQDEKVSNLEQYKKGMMQKIFSQEIRFKKADGGEYPEWEKEHLGNIVERVARKNKGNITKRPLTISAQYGLVDQEEFFNKVVASSNLEGYYLLNKGEFAYNKSYSNGYPFGAIKRLDRYENGAVSTLYICFIPKEHINSDYLVQYFESGMWHKEVSMVAVEGARNHGLLNISVSDFFETIHKVPCLDEQIKIAKFLSKIDSIVEKEKEKLEELRVWKKGLLQGMFI